MSRDSEVRKWEPNEGSGKKKARNFSLENWQSRKMARRAERERVNTAQLHLFLFDIIWQTRNDFLYDRITCTQIEIFLKPEKTDQISACLFLHLVAVVAVAVTVVFVDIFALRYKWQRNNNSFGFNIVRLSSQCNRDSPSRIKARSDWASSTEHYSQILITLIKTIVKSILPFDIRTNRFGSKFNGNPFCLFPAPRESLRLSPNYESRAAATSRRQEWKYNRKRNRIKSKERKIRNVQRKDNRQQMTEQKVANK